MAYDGTPSPPPPLGSLFRAVEAARAAQAEALAAGLDRRPFDAALRALTDALALSVAPAAPLRAPQGDGATGDLVADFLSARVRRAVGARVQAWPLMLAHGAWAARAGRPAMTPHALARRLAELGLRKRLSGGRTWYLDVALAEGNAA